ncbi:PhzF family phenazine biosynthesis isomerase [Paenibacillus sp. FSL K6-2524]|uniref:PhzF family phenazine biosynthesis isomerase n=1 Tax=Paenibacillus sp. FSL K6-2524 TaxID=2954516 RepID=UPI0030F73673
MNSVNVLHYDAFSSVPNKGNPIGIVLNADFLTEDEMQNIAFKVGFNETVFVLNSEKADLRLKYFTPGHEINLCGHATIGSLYCLKSNGMFEDRNLIQIETNVGILPIKFDQMNDQLSIEMKQDRPQFTSFNGDIDKLAKSIGLVKEELDLDKPIVYGSTGTWTLLVPIKKLSSFNHMIPNNQQFPDVLAENVRSSIHPICFETYDNRALMHARHFSSPYSGTIEDPVTGTASGVMGAYYLLYLNQNLNSVEFIVEQGQEIGRDGRVHVKAIRSEEDIDIFISGTAIFVQELKIGYV